MAAQRRTQPAVSLAARGAELASQPAAVAWRSSSALPLRRRASDVSSALAGDGRALVTRSYARGRVVTAVALRRLEEQAARSELADEAVDRLLSAGVLDRLAALVLNHPATDRLVVGVLDDPGLDRLLGRVLDSRLIDELLDHVARSPQLQGALARQMAGSASDAAVGVPSATAVADDAAERVARSLRRRWRPQPSG